ncbi:MAG: DMT family transporter [Rhizobiales bacterium]|nr:DMT family transporter [Hyphomicrobiales bacterium]
MTNQPVISKGSRALFLAGAGEDRPAMAAMLMVGSLCLLGFQDSLIKLTSGDVSLWQFQLLRSSCNLILLMALARLLWGTPPPRPKRAWTVALRSLFMVGAMVWFFGGIPFLSLSDIAAGLYVFPLFVTVLSVVVLGEKVGLRRVLAVSAGFTGTLLILKPGTASFQWVSLMPVVAGLCFAGSVLTTRKLCREESPLTMAAGVAISFIIVAFAGLAVTTIMQPGDLDVRWPYLFTGWHRLELWVAGVIVLASCLNLTANIGLTKAYQSAESSWLAPFDYSYLVFATFWGFVMWNDVPDVYSLAGMALIAGAGCYIGWRERSANLRLKAYGKKLPPRGKRPTRLQYWSLPPV